MYSQKKKKRRNDRIFKGTTYILNVLFVLNLRIAKWILIRKDFIDFNVNYVQLGGMHVKAVWIGRAVSWSPLLPGVLKFDVDGAAWEKPSPVGIIEIAMVMCWLRFQYLREREILTKLSWWRF